VSAVAIHPPYRLRRFDRAWHAPVYRARVAAGTEAAALIPERWDAHRGMWVVDHSLDALRVQHGLVAV
jgi:hypothetical protein